MDSSERTETMERPTVSVVVPCYNAERYVREAVASAVGQTHQPLEVICVDDGSTDGTLSILRKLEAEHPNLVQVLTGPNRGAPAARNRGLEEAQGKWIQFLDADDVLLPEKLHWQLNAVGVAGQNPDFVVSLALQEDATGRVVIREVGGDNPWVDLVMHRLGITSVNLFRREPVIAVGGWDEALPCSQEYDLMFRLLKHGAQVHYYDAEPLARIGFHPGSVGKSAQAFTVSLGLRKSVMQHVYAESLMREDEKQAVWDYLFNWIRVHYAVSPQEAVAMHRDLIPTDYIPRPGGFTTSTYVWVYRRLGFERTERLKRAIGR